MDYFSLQNQNQLARVNDDGTFCGTIILPHSQICFIDASPHTIIPLLSVSDTLETVFTPDNYVLIGAEKFPLNKAYPVSASGVL